MRSIQSLAAIIGLIFGLFVIPVWGQINTNGALFGSIVNEQIEPITSAIITIQEINTQNLYQTFADSEGFFTIENIPAGSYRLSIEADHYEVKSFKLNFVAGALLQLNFTLKKEVPINVDDSLSVPTLPTLPATATPTPPSPIQYGVITGQVLNRAQQPEFDLLVSAIHLKSRKSWQTTLTETGAFCLDGLPAGEYEIYVNRRGFNTLAVNLDLIGNSIVLIKLTLKE